MTQRYIQRCEHAIAGYERFFEDEGISRQTLQGMLAAYLPEARHDAFKSSRQSAFKARSIIAGYSADAIGLSLFLFGGTRPGRCHVAVVRACRGWRRLRQECDFAAHGYRVREIAEDRAGVAIAHTDLNGVPLVELGRAPLIEPFCSKPLPRFERVDIQNGRNYYLISDDVGNRSACTFVVGEILTNSQLRWCSEGSDAERFALESLVVATPTKRATFDIFVESGIWNDRGPEIELYNIVPQGLISEKDYAVRQHDRMDMGINVQSVDPAAPESPVTAVYGELVQYVLKKIRREAGDFRCYRCDMPYPLYGTQTTMKFELDVAP